MIGIIKSKVEIAKTAFPVSPRFPSENFLSENIWP